jgi:hypothetical protein
VRSASLATTLPTIVALFGENQGTLAALKGAPFSEPDSGVRLLPHQDST